MLHEQRNIHSDRLALNFSIDRDNIAITQLQALDGSYWEVVA